VYYSNALLILTVVHRGIKSTKLRREKLKLLKSTSYGYPNTQYMKNSTFVYMLKIEYVPKINILGLEMMMKNGLRNSALPKIIFLTS
jgi:hypothetical protein